MITCFVFFFDAVVAGVDHCGYKVDEKVERKDENIRFHQQSVDYDDEDAGYQANHFVGQIVARHQFALLVYQSFEDCQGQHTVGKEEDG